MRKIRFTLVKLCNQTEFQIGYSLATTPKVIISKSARISCFSVVSSQNCHVLVLCKTFGICSRSGNTCKQCIIILLVHVFRSIIRNFFYWNILYSNHTANFVCFLFILCIVNQINIQVYDINHRVSRSINCAYAQYQCTCYVSHANMTCATHLSKACATQSVFRLMSSSSAASCSSRFFSCLRRTVAISAAKSNPTVWQRLARQHIERWWAKKYNRWATTCCSIHSVFRWVSTPCTKFLLYTKEIKDKLSWQR